MTALAYPSPNGASEPRPPTYEEVVADNARLRQDNARLVADRDRWKAEAVLERSLRQDTQKQLSSVTTLLGCPKFTDSQKIRMWAVMHATQHAAAKADPDGWCTTSLYDIVTVAGIPVTPADETEESRKKALGNAFSTASKAVTMAADMGLIERGEPTYYHDDPADPRRITGCKQPVRLLASPDEAFRRAILQAPEPEPKRPRGRHVKLPKCPNCQSENLHIKCVDCGYCCTGEEYALSQLPSEEEESPGLQNLQTEDTDYTRKYVSAEIGEEDDDTGLQNLQSGTNGAQTPENAVGSEDTELVVVASASTAGEPAWLPLIPGAIPEALAGTPRFMTWKPEPNAHRWDKPPRDARTGYRASKTDRSHWSTFAEALDGLGLEETIGVGLCLTERDPIGYGDLDGCRDPTAGGIEPWALEIVNCVPTYWEVSPSGRGLRAWFEYDAMPADACHRWKIGGHEVEVYWEAAFGTVTGHHLPGTPAQVRNCTAELAALWARCDHPPLRPPASGNGHRASAATHGAMADEEVLDRVRRAANGAKFRRLYDAGDVSAYQRDGESGRHPADAGLCAMFAFYTKDQAQLDRLMRGSALLRDPERVRKWERFIPKWHMTYGEHTIQLALSGSRP